MARGTRRGGQPPQVRSSSEPIRHSAAGPAVALPLAAPGADIATPGAGRLTPRTELAHETATVALENDMTISPIE